MKSFLGSLCRWPESADEETRLTNKLLVRMACIVWFCVAQIITVMDVSAQGFDVEPPIIEHEVIESAEAADRQSFTATVADDDELASVRFLYRFEGDRNYTSVEMDRVSFSSTFIVQVPMDIQSDRAIQYYFEARDVSGNRTLRGYNFSPLVRFIELPQPAVVPAVEPEPAKRNYKPFYYVAGALVLGALVGALANSSGGDDGSINPGPMNTGDCLNGLCDFTITINAPGGP